jgi:hypothetical protein
METDSRSGAGPRTKQGVGLRMSVVRLTCVFSYFHNYAAADTATSIPKLQRMGGEDNPNMEFLGKRLALWTFYLVFIL